MQGSFIFGKRVELQESERMWDEGIHHQPF